VSGSGAWQKQTPAAAGPGHSIEPAVRSQLEHAFGESFADVTVHTDNAAVEQAAAFGADAFTSGEHVVFAAGRYAPGSKAGRTLLAHELAHVVQRRRASGGTLPVSAAVADVEQDADRAAVDATSDGDAAVALASAAPVLRQAVDQGAQRVSAVEWLLTRHISLRRSVEGTHWGSAAERSRFIRDYLTYCATHSGFTHELTEAAAAYPDEAQSVGLDAAPVGPQPMTPVPRPTVVAPAQTSAGAVDDIAAPVVVVPITDDRKVRELVADERAAAQSANPGATLTPARRDQIAGTPTPPADPDTFDFNGLTAVRDYARALATELGRRRQARVTTRVLGARQEEARHSARTAAEAETVTGETAAARRRRIAAAQTAAAAGATGPTADEATEIARKEAMAALVASWIRHVHAPSTQGYTVGHLANAWMNNRGQEGLVDTETVTRPTDQARMWSNLWITPPAADETPMESDTTRGVGLGTVPGGTNSGATLIDPRIVPFLTDLHTRIPHVSYGTYAHHGSVGFAGRGLSIDMTLSGVDRASGDTPRRDWGEQTASQWYARSNAADLLLALDAAAAATNTHFFAIYNDFSVARFANMHLHNGSVGFAANIDAGGSMNYHGGGEKLHVHVDILPADLAATTRPVPPPPPATHAPAH
jgi:hypothetical protein